MGQSPTETTTQTDSKSPVQPNASPPQVKAETNNTEPLAPPPRPEPAAPAVSNTPDYFSVAHGTHLSYETNPFENSFATGGAGSTRGDQTPGGTKLPSVASLTSPSGLLGSGATPNFWGSLRSGPLSPAMLSGPQKDDYFSDGHHLRGGFPTPNESGLRSGLTPGGGGSMFPEPSPNSQALFNQLAGAATPGTLDFQRTALNAAAAQRKMPPTSQPSVTSQPQELPATLDVKPQVPGPFDQHDANDAANGLFLLAQAQTRNNGSQQTNHYAMASQMPVHAHPQPMMPIAGQSAETSPNVANRNNSSVSTNSARGVSEMSGQSDENDQQNRPNTRGKNKRSSTQMSQTNGRRKADETPSKAPAGKKGKGNNGQATEAEQQSEEEQDTNKDEYNSNGKKMTDEEKRKNFLERNRVAALKCRQRKKQWLANLQQKVEIFSTENDALSAQIQSLRDEVVNLKTLLLAHKDCPIAQQQGLQGMMQEHVMGGYGAQMNPYGMAAAMNNQQVMASQQAMQGRRYS
ncbi:hypothetical protein M430DRAFT_46584 [Amorphotheca resinae ATCC 22711]|uniref:BZIP domain-containing protein n=1 Tax=Amorphotheca resinae ATCC 22711 TaxID=857342 RepID=A0A2T3BDP4_AMORE|nr:hypothetical protein M430DRAFT_46584 [Amorphotheca resinae ATCC 22711]PSS27492.1 hypothetical protein M430DRAFT_46584 [Amorphotheca resinae ATCC 22711]